MRRLETNPSPRATAFAGEFGRNVLPATSKTYQGQDLAGAQRKAHRPCPVRHQAGDGQDNLRSHLLRLPEDLLQRPADDAADQSVRRDIGHPLGQDVPAVTQHGDPVRDPEHLVQTMRDVENGEA